MRDLTVDDATMQERFTAPRAALNLGGADAEGFDERTNREKQPA
jgi:hypothetical protein